MTAKVINKPSHLRTQGVANGVFGTSFSGGRKGKDEVLRERERGGGGHLTSFTQWCSRTW